MNSYEFEENLYKVLTNHLHKIGFLYPVILAYQNTSNSPESGIYYSRLSDRSYGWQKRTYNKPTLKELRVVEATYQFRSYLLDREDVNPADILNTVVMCMQSLPFIEDLVKVGITMQKPSSVQDVRILVDNQYENSPSMSVTFTYKEELSQSVPFLESDDVVIKRV